MTIGLSLQRHDRGHGLAAVADLHRGQLEHAQTVTVTGVDDAWTTATSAYTIVTAAATSADANYNGLNAADVSVTNTDNDAAGITVTPDQRPDHDRGRRHGDLHGRAELPADGRRDDRPDVERHDRRHGLARQR